MNIIIAEALNTTDHAPGLRIQKHVVGCTTMYVAEVGRVEVEKGDGSLTLRNVRACVSALGAFPLPGCASEPHHHSSYFLPSTFNNHVMLSRSSNF
jgi:hypothetical protein